MFKKRMLFPALGAAVLAFGGVALATGGFDVNAVIQARAAFLDPADIKIKVDGGHQEVFNVLNAQDTVMQQITLSPLGHTGWHSHPGPAIALIKSGALTLYSGDDPACAGRTYTAGQAFIDSGQGHVHIARNESNTDTAEVWVTYLDVPPGASPRNDVPRPGNCSF